MAAPDRHTPTWSEFRAGMRERLGILLAAGPRHAPDLWVVVCVLALGVVGFYTLLLAGIL